MTARDTLARLIPILRDLDAESYYHQRRGLRRSKLDTAIAELSTLAHELEQQIAHEHKAQSLTIKERLRHLEGAANLTGRRRGGLGATMRPPRGQGSGAW